MFDRAGVSEILRRFKKHFVAQICSDSVSLQNTRESLLPCAMEQLHSKVKETWECLSKSGVINNGFAILGGQLLS